MELIEKEETESLHKEVNTRRMRLDSVGPEEIGKEVGMEIWGSSEVSIFRVRDSDFRARLTPFYFDSCLNFTMPL